MNKNEQLNEERFLTVKAILDEHLEKNNQRKTPERYAILRGIYDLDDHFSIEEIFELMKTNNYRVSRATLYNTIELLIECNLVTKHSQPQHNQATYEASHFSRQHDHLILEDGEIIEFCDPRIEHIKKTMEELFDVKIDKHTLYFYGSRNKKEE